MIFNVNCNYIKYWKQSKFDPMLLILKIISSIRYLFLIMSGSDHVVNE